MYKALTYISENVFLPFLPEACDLEVNLCMINVETQHVNFLL